MLVPDRVELLQFTNAVFRHASHGDVLLRAFSGDEPWRKDQWRRARATDILELVAEAEALAQLCAQATEPVVFCTPIATFHPGRGSEANLSQGLVLAAECDEWPELARDYLERVLGVPTCVVASGGTWDNPDTGRSEDRLHIYWRLAEPAEEHADLKEARRLIQLIAGSDGSAVPIVHPMRWPGSWHRKAEPRMAHITGGDPHVEVRLDRALWMLRHATGQARRPAQLPGDPLAGSTLEVAVQLYHLPNADLPWDLWSKIGMAVWASTGGSEEGFRLWSEWSSKSAKQDPAVDRGRWDHWHQSPPTKVGFGTLVYLVRLHGVDPDVNSRREVE